MDSNFGSIGDFLPEREVKCRVRGCNNIVHISSRMAMQNVVDGKSTPARMCDECYALMQTLEDKEVPCSTPGCEGKWVWTRYQQLVSIRGGHTTPPRGYCQECHAKMDAMEARQIPCRLKGCHNTWTLSAAEQIKLNGKAPQPRLCDECYKILTGLQDKEVHCRIRGCRNTFIWNRFQQLEHIRSGKSVDAPPRLMCEECHKIARGLQPQEVKCRIRGCEHKWTFGTFEQLELIVKARNEALDKGEALPEDFKPQPPERMCNDCYAFFQQAQDIEQPCRNHQCKNTWTYTRSMQLSQKMRGRDNAPARYCDACEKILETLQDKQMPCMQEGCNGTWTYSRDEQLKDQTAGRQPQKKRCAECSRFLTNARTIQVTCSKCGASFDVSSIQQLEVKLGTAEMPTLCADCASKEINADIADSGKLDCISRPKIYIPKSGPWQNDEFTQRAPSSVDQAAMDAFAEAERRVVCIGDELGCISGEGAKDWTLLLKEALAERVGETAVLNVSMPHTTTERCLLRFGRDVAPFKPQLVIFSCVFADTLESKAELSGEELSSLLEKADADFKALVTAIRELGAKPLCWIPNPVYWNEGPEASRQLAGNFDALAQQLAVSARQNDVPLVDARTNFAIAGEQTTRKWMADWCHVNDIGASSIANWLKNEIMTGKLLQ